MKFHVENMVCQSCVKHITQAISALDPEAKIDADIEKKQITVTSKASASSIVSALEDDGYSAQEL